MQAAVRIRAVNSIATATRVIAELLVSHAPLASSSFSCIQYARRRETRDKELFPSLSLAALSLRASGYATFPPSLDPLVYDARHSFDVRGKTGTTFIDWTRASIARSACSR